MANISYCSRLFALTTSLEFEIEKNNSNSLLLFIFVSVAPTLIQCGKKYKVLPCSRSIMGVLCLERQGLFAVTITLMNVEMFKFKTGKTLTVPTRRKKMT